MRILDRRSSLPPLEERPDHAADDRARPDDRDLDDDVVEAPRGVPRQRRHLRAALDLEEADRVGGVQHPVDRRIVLRQVREIHLDPLVRADHRDRLLDRREHAEAEQIHLHDAEVRAVVLVPLHDDAARHGRRLERHDLVEPARRDDDAARVLAEMARQVLDLEQEAQEVARAPLLRIEPRRGELALQLLGRIADLAEVPAAELLRERVHLLGRVAEGLGDLARRGAVAVGDDVGGHAGAVRAVLPRRRAG